jgi:hypothetical protein
LFEETDLFELAHPDYPGERLVACKNPALAEERTRKRESLLASTEAELGAISAAVGRPRRALRGKDAIALRVGKVVNHYKMAKHFNLEIGEASFSFSRKDDQVAAEAALDGIYVLRTSLGQEALASLKGASSGSTL